MPLPGSLTGLLQPVCPPGLPVTFQIHMTPFGVGMPRLLPWDIIVLIKIVALASVAQWIELWPVN